MADITQLLNKLSELDDKSFLSDCRTNLTLAGFLGAVDSKRRQLRNNGIGRSHVALVPTGDGLQYFVNMCAYWCVDATVVPVSHLADGAYIAYLYQVLGNPADCKMPVTDPVSWENPKFSDYATIWFTSGSSGVPKGVLHHFDNIIGNAVSTVRKLGMHSQDRLLTNIPYNFTSLICHFLATLVSGAALTAVSDKLFPRDLHAAIESAEATCFGGSPLQILWLAESSDQLSRPLRWCMSSGDDLPVSTIHKFRDKYPHTEIFTVYGLTELGGRACILEPRYLDTKAGSVGMAIDGLQISIRDENLNELPAEESGEILIAGDYMLRCFVEQQHNNAITPYGYRTGDIGYKDRDGFLYLQGRTDDVFKVAGQKVSSLLIRRELLATDLFVDAAVTAKTDPLYGSIPVAILVIKKNLSITKGQLIGILRKKLPLNHIPKEFRISENIERTGSGKIKKQTLITRYFDLPVLE